jgi:ribosomal protein S18 acetylase RimI-like enzyme
MMRRLARLPGGWLIIADCMATSRRSSPRAAKPERAAKPTKPAAATKAVAATKPTPPLKSAKARLAAATKPAAAAKRSPAPKSRGKKALIPPPPPRVSSKSRKSSGRAIAIPQVDPPPHLAEPPPSGPLIEVRRIHRRDINRVWEFLKRSFRDVNSETVEYQRPRSKHRFEEIYEEEGVQQLLFVVGDDIVAYAECTYEVTGSDNWINPRYFEKRDMRPMFIEELAVHPDWHGRGVGSFVLEQLHHLARVNGLTHLVLEVAENNENALAWYKKRMFKKLDAAIFMACALDLEPELLPPRALPVAGPAVEDPNDSVAE